MLSPLACSCAAKGVVTKWLHGKKYKIFWINCPLPCSDLPLPVGNVIFYTFWKVIHNFVFSYFTIDYFMLYALYRNNISNLQSCQHKLKYKIRTERIKQQKLPVVGIPNNEVNRNFDEVCRYIYNAAYESLCQSTTDTSL